MAVGAHKFFVLLTLDDFFTLRVKVFAQVAALPSVYLHVIHLSQRIQCVKVVLIRLFSALIFQSVQLT